MILTFFCLRILAPATETMAQENVLLHPDKFYKKFFPKLRIKRDPPDTVYIKTYPNYLSVGMHVLSPSIRMNLKPRVTTGANGDATSKFKTNIGDILGFSASYRFVSAGFAFVLKSGIQTQDDYAKSRYRTATIKYTGSAFSFQYKYLRFKGFTDVNHFSLAQRYRHREDIVNKEFQFEGLYNFDWRKYSYVAPFTFTQRQVKSRVGLLLKAGIYYNQLIGDSALVSRQQEKSYDDFEDVRVIRALSIRIAPGIGGNLVFLRRYYFSAAAFPSYDLYLYKYLKHPDDKVSGKHAMVFVLDAKASLGYQSRRLYGGLRYEAERRGARLKNINVSTVYSYVGIELGYRFIAPRIVKKVYKKTMPPGM